MDYVTEEKKFCCQLTLPGLITCHMNGEKKSKNAMASASISDQLIKHLRRDASIHFFCLSRYGGNCFLIPGTSGLGTAFPSGLDDK